MPDNTIRGRFAPSPSGRLHLGNMLTFLLAWLDVRARGGTMVFRLEDLDPERSWEHYADLMADDLLWLGLDWDEGWRPGSQDCRQGTRTQRYTAALDALTERGMVYDEFNSKQHEILTGVVTRIDPRTNAVSLRIGTGTESTEALLLSGEQVPGEELVEGQHVKVYVVDVRRSTRGPQILISRTHPGLVKRLFELEVPEIYDGTVEVKSIAREAGSRTKMAVWSADENVDPIGACVGPKGQRVAAIVDELRGEKIDIIKWSEDPAQFIAAALAPSDVVDVMMAEEGKACRVIVPDDQLSLAIGKEGQNARLAARLTGYKIDIKPESYHDEEEPPAGGAPEAADTAEASAVEPVDAE